MSGRQENIRGGRELDELLKTLPEKMQRNVNRAGLRAGAQVIKDEVDRQVPRDTGDLAATVRITSRINKATGNVSASVKAGGKYKGVDAWYARLVEYGTKPHLVQVSDKDRGINRRTGKQISVTTINRQQAERSSLNIGGNLVGPSVQHPGAKGRPFMRPAADIAMAPAVEAVTKKIRERLTKQGLNTPAPIPSDPEE